VSEDISLNGRLFVSGNVGIGTNATVYSLDVSSGTGTKIHDMYINAQGGGTMAIGSLGIKNANKFGTGFALYQGSGGDTVLNAYLGQPIDFKINNVTKMRLAEYGYVGIGTGTPAAPLHVACSIDPMPDANGILCYNHNNIAGNCSIITVRTAGSSAGNPFFSMDVAGVIGWCMGLDNGDSQKFKISNSWNNLATNTKMTITTGGNVGIGLTNPSYLLDVAGIINKTNTFIHVEFKNNSNTTPISVASSSVNNLKYTSVHATGGFSAISSADSITIPYSGLYKIGVRCQGAAGGAVNSCFTIWVLKNNTNMFIPFQMGFPGISSFTQTLYGEGIHELSANDSIKLSLSNSSTGTINVDGANLTLLRL
jgi:hypothetical protein